MGFTSKELETIRASVEPLFPHHIDHFMTAMQDMLNTAEKMFGKRDDRYTVFEVRFGGNRPRVTHLVKHPNHLVIFLSLDALEALQHGEDFHLAFWQLSHETVHLLSGDGENTAIVLEEGLACYFQTEYMVQRHHFWWSPDKWWDSYVRAYLMVHELLQWDQDIIKRIRREEPVISRMTPGLLLEYCPQASPQLATALTQRFDDGFSYWDLGNQQGYVGRLVYRFKFRWINR